MQHVLILQQALLLSTVEEIIEINDDSFLLFLQYENLLATCLTFSSLSELDTSPKPFWHGYIPFGFILCRLWSTSWFNLTQRDKKNASSLESQGRLLSCQPLQNMSYG